MFFANPPPVHRMRMNHFLKVEPPITRTLIDLEQRIDRFSHLMENETAVFSGVAADEAEEVKIIADTMRSTEQPNPIERGVSALLAFHNRNNVAEEAHLSDAPSFTAMEQAEVNLFGKPHLSDFTKNLVGPAQLPRFSEPLVNRAQVKDKIELLERVMGKTGSQASAITGEVLKDMLSATDYPPFVDGLLREPTFVIETVNEVVEYVKTLQGSGD
jgi:intracellular multiplication protein IcmO